MKKTCGDYGGHTKSGTPCKNPAGFRTNHPGEGKCYLPGHGGCSTGRPITTGVNAKKTSRQLRDKMTKHLANPNPLDLTGELALLRSLIDHFMEKLEEAEKDPTREDAGTFILLVQGVQKVADTISKIQSRELLTIAEMTLVLVVLADVLREEVKDADTLERITSKLRTRICLPGQAEREALLGGGD
jgi:hypothetical protein